MKVSVIGAGTMGAGIAQIAAIKDMKFAFMTLLMEPLKRLKTNSKKFWKD